MNFKCGKCKLWNNRPQGENDKDIKKQYKLFRKVLGMCNCKFGKGYPMFNYEECPMINYYNRDSESFSNAFALERN